MDKIVKAALNKWPNVPHCYGWLALDARGVWRMRDERAQALNLPGDSIRNAALLGFINRNYQHDEQGRWYFQNGPQRVYVDLEATPYIARSTPDAGLLLHTGAPLRDIDSVFLSADGKLMFRAGELLAQLDDRDLAACLNGLQMGGHPASDEALMEWLVANESTHTLSLELGAPQRQILKVQRAGLAALMTELNFISVPRGA